MEKLSYKIIINILHMLYYITKINIIYSNYIILL